MGLHEAFRVPAALLKKPWESPQTYCQSSHSGGDSVPKLSKPASIWLFSESPHCTDKRSSIDIHVENQRPEVEWPGRVTWKTLLYNSHHTPPFKRTSSLIHSPLMTKQSTGDQEAIAFFWEKCSVLKSSIEKQHPRDLFKSKGSSKRPDHWTILPSQKYTEQA